MSSSESQPVGFENQIKASLEGIVTQNQQNREFSSAVTQITEWFTLVDGYVANLEQDAFSLNTYHQKLAVLKKRGFKVANALARLKYQVDSTEAAISNVKNQKSNRISLLKNDIVELSRHVLDYRIKIDDKEDGVVQKFRSDIDAMDAEESTLELISRLSTLTLTHMSDLQDDVQKFDPQIQEAQTYTERNFDVGDLVETLKAQRDETQQMHTTYSDLLVRTARKHHERTRIYLEETASTANRVKETQQQSKESDKELDRPQTPADTPAADTPPADTPLASDDTATPTGT